MFDTATTASAASAASTASTASTACGARAAAAALPGLAAVALESRLRVPVRPLFDGYVQEAQARVAAIVRQLRF